MKTMKAIGILLLGISFLLAGCGSCKRENGPLKAKISMIDGRKIIKNPSTPLYGEIQLELVETLTIGHKEDEFLGIINGVDIDNNGNIYVLDFKKHCFKIFDSQGHFIRSIGKLGMGPQDLYEPTMLKVDSSGKIFVVDNSRRVRVFDSNGMLLKIARLRQNPLLSFVAPDGSLIGTRTQRISDKMYYRKILLKISPDGSSVIKEYLTKNIADRIRLSSGDIIISINEFTHDICYFLSKSGNLYCGDSDNYKIFIYDKQDVLTKEIHRAEEKSSISAEEKDNLVRDYYGDRYDNGTKSKLKDLIPDYKPFFFSLLVDDKERLYVFKRYTAAENELLTVDIFDSSGQYIYRTRMAMVPILIHAGYLYATVEEYDDLVLKKMLMKNL